MLLRSGKVKELVAKCYKCNEFYGNKRYKYKCSSCHDGGLKSSYPWRDETFRNSVNKWAEEKIQTAKNGGVFRHLKHLMKAYNGSVFPPARRHHERVAGIIKIMKLSYKESRFDLYISAKDGEELLRRTGMDCPEKSHIICPLILDWWNMKNYDYKRFEMCYYGRFGDEMTFAEEIKSIPPPPPHKCMISL